MAKASVLLLLPYTAAGAKATGDTPHFHFPTKVRWTFNFELEGGVRGKGIGIADWAKSEDQPRYRLEEEYEKNTLGADFNVIRDVTAGDAGTYQYSYSTVNGKEGCLPALLQRLPRRMFPKESWMGSEMREGKQCHRWAATLDLGAPGTLSLTACNGVPVETHWINKGARTPSQRCYLTSFTELQELPKQDALFTPPGACSPKPHRHQEQGQVMPTVSAQKLHEDSRQQEQHHSGDSVQLTERQLLPDTVNKAQEGPEPHVRLSEDGQESTRATCNIVLLLGLMAVLVAGVVTFSHIRRSGSNDAKTIPPPQVTSLSGISKAELRCKGETTAHYGSV